MVYLCFVDSGNLVDVWRCQGTYEQATDLAFQRNAKIADYGMDECGAWFVTKDFPDATINVYQVHPEIILLG